MPASIRFLGAVGTVTGSRHLLEIDGEKNLIDCGLFQGPKRNRERNWEKFPVSPEEIDRIFLTHAHIDHTGYLPKLVKEGFSGSVYCTRATADLCDIMLRDSAHLQEEDAYWANKRGFSKHSPALPLYTIDDAETALSFLKPVFYGDDIYFGDDIRVKFKNAGHILGSSFIDIKRLKGKDSKKILFSGDIGRPDRLILREPDQVYNVDYLILESTYGNRLHEEEDPVGGLAEIITENYKRRGVLVIPAFSVGRTQTLLYAIGELEREGKIPKTPVYVDSPMAINALKVFEDKLNDLNLTIRKKKIKGIEVFKPENLHICKSVEESKKINEVSEKAIIISASGMATGGRILHHLGFRLPERQNTVLFIGYQAEGTRGRTILDGKREVKIHGRMVPIRARIESITGFSGHGDYQDILAWLTAFNRKPKMTFIVHGEPGASASMAEKIREVLHWNVTVPEIGKSYELDF